MPNTSHKRTTDERKAQAAALHASIVEEVQRLTESGQWRRFLDFARSFHTYSLNNVFLILAQNPDATMVAGFRQWQTKGRQVRKGETSIKIFGCSTRKIGDTDNDANDEEQHIAHFFPVLSVFDISQTDPIDGIPQPENPVRNLTSDNDHGVLAPLTAHLENRGWTIRRQALTQANGYSDPVGRVVVLERELRPAQAAKTLLHEAAHIHLRHTDSLKEYCQHRGQMEVEAESVAYIVAGLSGLDTSAYSIGYITGWADEDLSLIRETATRVLEAAQELASITAP